MSEPTTLIQTYCTVCGANFLGQYHSCGGTPTYCARCGQTAHEGPCVAVPYGGIGGQSAGNRLYVPALDSALQPLESIGRQLGVEQTIATLTSKASRLEALLSKYGNPYTIEIWNNTGHWEQFCHDAPISLQEAEKRVEEFEKENPQAKFRAIPWLNTSQYQQIVKPLTSRLAEREAKITELAVEYTDLCSAASEQAEAWAAKLAERDKELAEWKDYWGCESPHDSHVQAGSAPGSPGRQLGIEQARANRAENALAELQTKLTDADRTRLGLRKKIHQLEAHNQHFERCESEWCHPKKDGLNPDPALEFALDTKYLNADSDARASRISQLEERLAETERQRHVLRYSLDRAAEREALSIEQGENSCGRIHALEERLRVARQLAAKFTDHWNDDGELCGAFPLLRDELNALAALSDPAPPPETACSICGHPAHTGKCPYSPCDPRGKVSCTCHGAPAEKNSGGRVDGNHE